MLAPAFFCVLTLMLTDVVCCTELYASFGDVGISGNQSDDWDGDLCDPDAQLSLIERLEKYVDAEHVYSRSDIYYFLHLCVSKVLEVETKV